MAQPKEKVLISEQIKELSGVCLICSGLPVLIPGVTLTVVGYTSDKDDTFKRYGSLHIFGLALLAFAIFLIIVGLILKIVWRNVVRSDVQRVINASLQEDQQREAGDPVKDSKGLPTKHTTEKKSERGHCLSNIQTLHGKLLLLCGITLLIPGLVITVLGFTWMSDDILGTLGALHIIGLIILIIAVPLMTIGVIILIVLRIKSRSKDQRVGQAPVTASAVQTDSIRGQSRPEINRVAIPPRGTAKSSEDLPPLKGAPQKQILRSSSRTNYLSPLKSRVERRRKADDSDESSSESSDTDSSSSSDGHYTHKYGSMRRKDDIELAQVHKPTNSALVFEQDKRQERVGDRDMERAYIQQSGKPKVMFEQEKRADPALSPGGGKKLNYLHEESSSRPSRPGRKQVANESGTEDSDSDSSDSDTSSTTSSESDNIPRRPNYQNRPQSSKIRNDRIS